MFEMKEWCKQLANAIACNYTDFKNINGQDLDELGKWIDIKKDLAEMEYYEAEKLKNLSIIEAMDKEEQGSEMMGYNNRRYASGRYAPTGRGRVGYASEPYGYTPESYGYMPEMYGYIPIDMRRGENSTNMNEQNRFGYSQDGKRSGYFGKAYDKFNQARRYYTETKDPEHRRQMNASVNEVMTSITDMLGDMWKDMDAEQKEQKKEELIDKISRLPTN